MNELRSLPEGGPPGARMALDRALEMFLASAVDSPHTRRAYRRHLCAAFQALEATSLLDLEAERLADYRGKLLADGRGAATHAQALAALRSFLLWVSDVSGGRINESALRRLLKSPRNTVVRPFPILNEGEIGALLPVAETSRERVILLILLGSGIRASEAVGLDITDLRQDIDGGYLLHVRGGKGGKDRLVPIHAEVALCVHQYLGETGRRPGGTGALLLAEQAGRQSEEDPAPREVLNRRIHVRTLGRIVEALRRRAGIGKPVSPHAYRHTFSTSYIRNGGSVVALQKLLGHASLNTTQRYPDHLALGELREAIPRFTE